MCARFKMSFVRKNELELSCLTSSPSKGFPIMNRTIRNSALVASSLLAIPALAACGAGEAATGDTLTFAAIPAESSQSLQSDFANIVALLEQEAGVSIEFQNASDYAAVIEGQRAGQIDMASYGRSPTSSPRIPAWTSKQSPLPPMTKTPHRPIPPWPMAVRTPISTLWKISTARKYASSTPHQPPATWFQ